MEARDLTRISEKWYVFDFGEKQGPFTYLELAKLLDNQTFSLSLHGTRREDDDQGAPLGEIGAFKEIEISKFISRISPPHTPLQQARSFLRIRTSLRAVIKTSQGNELPLLITSLSAGGCKVESFCRLSGISLENKLKLFIPNLGHISSESLSVEAKLIHSVLGGLDETNKYEATLKFEDFPHKEKVALNNKIIEGLYPDFFRSRSSKNKMRRIVDYLGMKFNFSKD